MLHNVRCIDATAKQMAQMSNGVLKRSRKFAEAACSKNILSSQKPWFTSESVKKFYNISDFYEKSGEIKQEAKPLFAKILKEFGLKKDATLFEFMNFISNVYK